MMSPESFSSPPVKVVGPPVDEIVKLIKFEDRGDQKWFFDLTSVIGSTETTASPWRDIPSTEWLNWFRDQAENAGIRLPSHFYGTHEKPGAVEPKQRGLPAKQIELEKENERLREEVSRLTFQKELLQTQVAEQRRSLAREARHSDKFQSEMDSLAERNADLLRVQDKLLSVQDNLLSLLVERGRANDALVTKIVATEGGRLRMVQIQDGQVILVNEDNVVMEFNVAGVRLRLTSPKKHFKDGVPPTLNAHVKKLVFLVEDPPICGSELRSPGQEPVPGKTLITGQEVPIIVGSPEWDALTQRRAELIYKKNRTELTSDEMVEFEQLQKISRTVVAGTFNPPRLSPEDLAEVKRVLGKNEGAPNQ
jgi:hypothetical protein